MIASWQPSSAQAAPEAQTIAGFVTDSVSGETLIGATISIVATRLGAVSDTRGYFIIHNVPPGAHTVRCRYVGFRTMERPVTVGNAPLRLAFALARDTIHATDITVEGARETEQHEVRVSTVNVTAAEVQQLPAFGESDLFRALQYLPGVLTASQLSSGLYIRGGSPDQNLVLLDGSTLYNPTHLFGFFSTFNNDAIKDVELIKGGFPAEYGGRLSAVISVTNKDGDRHATHGKISLGLISSRGTIETPLGDGSIFFSGRRTYIDLLTAALPQDPQNPIPGYYFFDLNGKLTQVLGDEDKAFASGYLGGDRLTENGGGINFNLGWGNWAGAARWTHLFTDKLVSELNVTGSHYYSTLDGDNGGFRFGISNTITDYTAKGNVDWYAAEDHLAKCGVTASLYTFNYVQNFNGSDTTSQPPNDSTNVIVHDYALGAFAQDAWQITPFFSAQIGLRVDWTQLAKTVTLDPRLSMRYLLPGGVTLKGAWGLYHQYLHLASQQNFDFFDVWLPSDGTTAAAEAIQYVLGAETSPWDGYDLSLDLYYKALHNITNFRTYAIRARTVADVFNVGSGQAYGAELFLQRRLGPVTGWIGYSLAWVTQRFADLNGGNPFPPKYDRRHDVNVVATWRIDERWRVGAAWVYGTGQTYTAAKSRFRTDMPQQTQGVDYTIPGDLNALRLPASHRLDANAAYDTHVFGHAATITLDVFNLYAHRDVWFRYYDTRQNPTQVTDVRLLPIIPTASIEVRF